ncbi:MAG: hypothetical protein KGI27_14155, partial [Thaumarchaeota archaeon]|nr:hypothetical protein [Nitrososphaerota archaeon]
MAEEKGNGAVAVEGQEETKWQRWGRLGGLKRAENMTALERSELGRLAATISAKIFRDIGRYPTRAGQLERIIALMVRLEKLAVKAALAENWEEARRVTATMLNGERIRLFIESGLAKLDGASVEIEGHRET